MIYEVKPQTLIVLVGPSNSGKSYFSNLLKSKIKQEYPQSKIQIISSDKIRSQLLDQKEFDKMGNWMYQISDVAFEMYYQMIENCMKFPVENDIIIADATNLSMDNITRLNEIANKYHYDIDYVVFYYNNIDDYFKYTDRFTLKDITIKHYKKLHKFYKDLLKYSKQKHHNIICVRKPIEDSIELTYYGLWKTYFNKQYFETEKNVLVIGDIHGKYKEMIELLNKFDITINGEKEIEINNDKIDLLVFCGDYIDKCPYENTIWMIDFVNKNIDKENIIFIRGNHERFVYNYLNRHKPYLQTKKEIIDNYFTSVKDLYNDENNRKKFFNWYHKTVKFVKLPNYIVCHAPTDRQNICKLHCDNMIKGDLPYGTNEEEYIKYFKQINRYEPIVVVGHKSTVYPFLYNNIVFIDGGADKGNLLCGCYINKYKDVKFKTVQIVDESVENITNFHILIKKNLYEQKKISFDDLDQEDLRRLKYLKKNGIKFISGTMPPAWATKDNIEDIDTVFNYYQRNGIKEVILEPKYMGSRINVYLNCEDVSKTKFITRNGYIAKLKDNTINILLQQCEEFVNRFKDKFNKLPKQIIIDGELLPWSLLGQSLIDNNFKLYSKLIEQELDILEKTNFNTMYNSKAKELNGILKLSKKQLISEHGHHIYRLCKLLNEFKYIPIDKRRNYLETFNKQLELYTNPDIKTEIKCFNVLKIDDKVLPFETNEESFKLFNDDEYLIVNVDIETEREKGRQFFHNLSYNKGFEGVVIKPNHIKSAVFNNIIPYFKVRNQDYLLIIYGYLYKEFYEEFIKTKNHSLSNKITACIQEWNAALKMLQSKSETDFVNAYLEFKHGENIELETDPRL